MKKDDNRFQSDESLRDLILQKEAAIQTKGRLIDNMSYQIRTLSNAVIGFSELLLSEKLSDDLLEYVNEINQAGNGLSSLVNEVLDWAQLESGRLKLNNRKCDLSGIIKQIETIVSSAAADKDLSYEIEVDPDLPSEIVSDRDHLLKCLLNLIANAFRSTQEGSVRIRIVQQCDGSQPFIRFDITDSGVGISPEKFESVFEPALRTEDVNNEVLTMLDMGITVSAGLPLTKQLVELLGGTLNVTSELNVESTFSAILPIGLEVDNIAKLGTYSLMPQEEQMPEDESHTSASILLVEDQQSNRTVLGLMLEMLGVLVETAEDGVDGVEKASQKEYDLILMDLKMPRMDGYQATRKIREICPKTPIVALSAKVLNDKDNHEIATIFDGFLTKPVDSLKLSETVQEFIPEVQLACSRKETASDETKNSSVTEEVVTIEYGS